MSDCLRFFNENYIDTTNLSNFTASSEATSFEKENAQDAIRRTKVWRTDGYWNITSSNNGIVFEETAATPLTASIAVAEYSNTSTLLTAIKTALEAVGASTYTVESDSTTGKIKITSDGLGGGGILNLLWTNVGSTAAGDLGFSTAADDTGALTYTADLLRIATEEFLTFDLGIASNPRAFAFVQARNNAIQISPGATITLEGNETDAWSSPSFTQTITYDSEVMFYMVASTSTGFHTEGLRYWRLSISDLDNADGYIEVGYIYLGEYYNTDQGAPQFPFQNAQQENSITVFSEGGQTFTDLRDATERFTLNMRFLSIAEKEELERTWNKYTTAEPLFVSMDTGTAFSSSTNQYLKLVRFESQPTFILETAGYWAMQLNLREVL